MFPRYQGPSANRSAGHLTHPGGKTQARESSAPGKGRFGRTDLASFRALRPCGANPTANDAHTLTRMLQGRS